MNPLTTCTDDVSVIGRVAPQVARRPPMFGKMPHFLPPTSTVSVGLTPFAPGHSPTGVLGPNQTSNAFWPPSPSVSSQRQNDAFGTVDELSFLPSGEMSFSWDTWS